SHTNGTADNQASVRVLGGVGELLALDEVLDGDQAAQALVGVDEGKFFHFVSAQQFESVIAGDIDSCGDQVLGGHDIADQSRTVAFETHVAVGDDTHEAALPVGDRYTGDPVTGAQAFHFGEGVLGATGDRVGDHACFGTFDVVDLGGLLLGGQVAVEHTRPTLASHRHGHPRLGDRVHGRRQQWNAQRDVAGQLRDGVDVPELNVGIGRNEEHIVVGQPRREQFAPVVVEFLAHDTTSASTGTPHGFA